MLMAISTMVNIKTIRVMAVEYILMLMAISTTENNNTIICIAVESIHGLMTKAKWKIER